MPKTTRMILENYSLKHLNTFGIDVTAARFCKVTTENEILSLIGSGLFRQGPFLITGGGSNLLFTGNYEGTVVNPAIGGITRGQTHGNITKVTVGAGVVWDDFVAWAVENGLGGTENLSLIPGHTGASAVQNIGAYGVEAAEIITEVSTIEIATGSKRIFTTPDCRFGYRNSIFKGELKGKYIITSVTFGLTIKHEYRLSYGSLAEEAGKGGKISLASVRDAVIAIRQSKLPDPSVTGNAGSFFKNPVVPAEKASELLVQYPKMPVYPAGNNLTKIAAGWLIEQCGWKGWRSGDAGVHSLQALVLVNHGNATGDDIFRLSENIRKSVLERFGVELEREVEVI